MNDDMTRAWAAWEAIERGSAVATFRLVGDYEGLWSCTVGWANEAESKRGFAQNQSTAAEAILAAVAAAEDTP